MAFAATRLLADTGRLLRSQYLGAIRAVRGPIARSHHARLPMRIGMTLLVRDEADIVAATIEHALDFGVDFILATDNGSVDGSFEILQAYRDLGVLELTHESAHIHDQGRWVTRMARRAAELGANWVINADADEFLWPSTDKDGGTLKDILGRIESGFGLIALNPDHHANDGARAGKWPQTAVLLDGSPTYAPGSAFVWKVAHRADARVRVAEGNHSADGPLIGPIAPERPLRLMHFPDRGYGQYERKIRNGGAALAANPRLRPAVGEHWRRDYELLLAGKLEAAYRARSERIAAQVDSGKWAYDFRMRDHLRALLARARRPDLLAKVLD
jgi:hypothetical protein